MAIRHLLSSSFFSLHYSISAVLSSLCALYFFQHTRKMVNRKMCIASDPTSGGTISSTQAKSASNTVCAPRKRGVRGPHTVPRPPSASTTVPKVHAKQRFNTHTTSHLSPHVT